MVLIKLLDSGLMRLNKPCSWALICELLKKSHPSKVMFNQKMSSKLDILPSEIVLLILPQNVVFHQRSYFMKGKFWSYGSCLSYLFILKNLFCKVRLTVFDIQTILSLFKILKIEKKCRHGLPPPLVGRGRWSERLNFL